MTQLTEETFEKTLQTFIRSDTIDLRTVSFIDPYGMVCLLEIGELCMLEDIKKTVLLPRAAEVQRYLGRMDFFRHAKRYFTLEPMQPPASGSGGETDVLLEITPIERASDIHRIVAKVEERAQSILAKHLHYDDRAISGFIVALSEICQNIVEHSENRGFVGIQKYRYPSRGGNIVKIAVADGGIGFRNSLAPRFKIAGDLEAIEKALLQGASRHADEGRGHGLAAVRRFVAQWNGGISIRSGTARLCIAPSGVRGTARRSSLIPFPGAQVHIQLPETAAGTQGNGFGKTPALGGAPEA